MSKQNNLIQKILRGTSDANINFNDLCHLLRNLNFEERIRGSHHIKQVRNLILKYRLGVEDDQI